MIGRSPDKERLAFSFTGNMAVLNQVGESLIVSIMPKPRLHDERNAAIIKSLQAGASVAEIALQFGLSRKRVGVIIAKQNRHEEYLRDSPFKSLGLSNILFTALVNSGFETIEQVENASDQEILMIHNVGSSVCLRSGKLL